MTECPICKAPGVCPVEDGVTFHRQYPPPPPPGWRPTREEVEAAVGRRAPEDRTALRAKVAEAWPDFWEEGS